MEEAERQRDFKRERCRRRRERLMLSVSSSRKSRKSRKSRVNAKPRTLDKSSDFQNVAVWCARNLHGLLPGLFDQA